MLYNRFYHGSFSNPRYFNALTVGIREVIKRTLLKLGAKILNEEKKEYFYEILIRIDGYEFLFNIRHINPIGHDVTFEFKKKKGFFRKKYVFEAKTMTTFDIESRQRINNFSNAVVNIARSHNITSGATTEEIIYFHPYYFATIEFKDPPEFTQVTRFDPLIMSPKLEQEVLEEYKVDFNILTEQLYYFLDDFVKYIKSLKR